jgi:tetratricopeptide (TPR) repeat protein
MRRSSLAATLFAFALITAPANADAPDAARAYYVAGRFDEAAAAAEQQRQSADSFSFAARSLLAAFLIGGGDAPERLDRAESMARGALALDPDSVDARLQLAIVYGLRGRRASASEAFAQRYAPRGRRLIDQALRLAPASAEAHALLGAWHLEILRRGGRAGAIAYGARLSEGVAAYDRALALAPDNAVIEVHYAAALLGLGGRPHETRARQLLLSAAAETPGEALESHCRRLALRLVRMLDAEGADAAARAARAAGL